VRQNHRMIATMLAVLHSLGMFIVDLFKSRRRLEAENLFLRHQLSIALRHAPPRLRLHGSDRALLVWMTRLWPSLLGATQVVQPETILRWHRAGFKAFWRWKSRKRAGRPKIDRGLRDLIRRISKENPNWGASRIHGELLMLGFEVAQSTVSKYMVQGGSPSQSWKTFFRNHAQAMAAIDLFVVPTLTFERLFAFLVMGHGRRQLLWFEVTRHPTAEWLTRQITEAFPWASAPAYLVRDNDRAMAAATGLLVSPPLLAESHLFGETRACGGIVRCYHWIVAGKTPLLAILLWCEVVMGAQVSLERLEFLSVLKADDVVWSN
jgi:hypothetical protein